MKKSVISLMFVLLLCSGAYAASDDVYVRKDVFEVEMRGINAKLDNIFSELKVLESELKAQGEEIKALTRAVAVLSERLDGVEKRLDTKIDGVHQSLSSKIDEVDKRLTAKIDEGDRRLDARIDAVNSNLNSRMSDLLNVLYFGLVLFAAVLILPFFSKWWEAREARKQASNPPFTLDDVKRLIAEAKLGATPQA